MRRGITLIEITIAVAIGVIVLGIVALSLNPARQLAQARDSQRKSHVNAIINAVRENIADNRTGFSCAAGDIPTSTKRMASSGTSTYDIAPCLVPTYLGAMPYDPSTSTAHYTSNTDYNTAYTILKSSSTGQITVSAPAAETATTTVTR